MQSSSRFNQARSSQYKDETTTFVHKTPTSVSQNIIAAIPFQQTPTQFSGSTVNQVVNHKISQEERVSQSNFQISELPSERVSSQIVATQRIANFATQISFQKKYEPFDNRDEDLVILQQSQRDPIPVRNLTVETDSNVYQDGRHLNISQQSVGMVLAQNQYGTDKQALIQRKKKSSLLYHKVGRNQDANDNSPELTTTVLSNDRLEQQSEKSKAFSAAKPSRKRLDSSKLSLTQRSHSSHGTLQMNYYREKQKVLQEINEQVRTSQAIQGRITSFKRQEERSLKRMQNLERVYKYTEETRALRIQSAERIKGLRKEQVAWKKEKKKQVETVKFEIDLYKGIKQKEIAERKKEIVKFEKKVKIANIKIKEKEKSIELKKRQASAERIKKLEKVALQKTQRFHIDLQSLHSMSRIENLEHYYKVAADDSTAVKKLEVIEAQALEKMQQTIKMENRHTEKLMNRLENDKNHKAFFIAAANKTLSDRSFDSEPFERMASKSKKQLSAQKGEVKWKWKP